MLIRYRFNNFCSFLGDYEFSMEAPRGKVKKRYPDNYVADDLGMNPLKTAVVLGENAGGKSNFIASRKYLKSLFSDNDMVRSFIPYVNTSSRENNENPVQFFEMELLLKGPKIYRYILEIDAAGIVCEELYFRKNRFGVEKNLFSFKRNKAGGYDISSDEKNRLASLIDSKQRGIGLIITKLAILGDENALAVTEWVNDSLSVELPGSSEQDAFRKRNTDLEIMKDSRYVEIFRMVDYSICGVQIDEEKPYSKTVIIRRDKDGRIMKRELSMDSAGVREFFKWAVQIFQVVYENKTVFADEMDRVLNPILSDRVVAFINGKRHNGQFIFSTHNVLHLNLVTYMKEQIYFITKDKDTLISDLYSLADFPEVRYENTKIYEFYMKGILGGTAYE
ncbi:MAG: ATP-binding protein [Lachnospiraceae bacterium]|nr:ATP-binding protein [Lachnospiraceae bacterium]